MGLIVGVAVRRKRFHDLVGRGLFSQAEGLTPTWVDLSIDPQYWPKVHVLLHKVVCHLSKA